MKLIFSTRYGVWLLRCCTQRDIRRAFNKELDFHHKTCLLWYYFEILPGPNVKFPRYTSFLSAHNDKSE